MIWVIKIYLSSLMALAAVHFNANIHLRFGFVIPHMCVCVCVCVFVGGGGVHV